MLFRVHLAMNGFRTLVVIDTDCTGSCKSRPRRPLDQNEGKLKKIHVYENKSYLSFQSNKGSLRD